MITAVLSILIVTFKGRDFIESCLHSIFMQDCHNCEVIVVDNGSRDGTVDFIRSHYPQVTLIENRTNLGACKARNQGIARARGTWLLLLDCDVTLQDNFIATAREKIADASSEIGIAQPKILTQDKKTIDSCGIYLSWARRFYDIGKNRKDNGRFNSARYIFGACSAAALYRKRMLDEIKDAWGYFDERFFFLVEDVDLSWRAQRKHWKAVFWPDVTCYHFGKSSGFEKKARQYLCFRNRFYSILKNEGPGNYLKKILPFVVYDLPRSLYFVFTNPYFYTGTRLLEREA